MACAALGFVFEYFGLTRAQWPPDRRAQVWAWVAWTFALWPDGPVTGIIGGVSGTAIGLLGAWLLSHLFDRASPGGGLLRWAMAWVGLVLLFAALVLVPSIAGAFTWQRR